MSDPSAKPNKSGDDISVRSQSDKIKSIAGALESQIGEQLTRIAIHVVIMGPSIEGPSELLEPAARLRLALIERCRAIGTTVTPEHDLLIDAARRKLGEGHDLCTYESHLIEHICHLLVIIPSSPGSLCELGFFAMLRHVCEKMIVLADSSRPRRGSYVADGPLAAAVNKRAIVTYVSYANETDLAFRVVEGEIQRIRAHLSVLEHVTGHDTL